ncbi:MAG: hypothetical protein LBB62_01815 [Proteiniphilum sp.]|jgi:hypothetical protein|nr:hypothetical protein [Proteiniphilum sp.]
MRSLKTDNDKVLKINNIFSTDCLPHTGHRARCARGLNDWRFDDFSIWERRFFRDTFTGLKTGDELPHRKRTGYQQGIIFIFRRKRRGINPKEIKNLRQNGDIFRFTSIKRTAFFAISFYFC